MHGAIRNVHRRLFVERGAEMNVVIKTDDTWMRTLQHSLWTDLSLVLSEGNPTWPLHMPLQHKIWNWFEKPPLLGQESRSELAFHTGWWTLDEHHGTHFDAPTHFIPPPDSGLPGAGPAGAMSGDLVPLARFHGPACVIDVRDLVGHAEPGVSPTIELDRVESFETEWGPIEPGDVVIFWSAWDQFYQPGSAGSGYALDVVNARAPGWPAPSVEVIEALYERGVLTLGTDGCSIGSSHDGVPGHMAGLSREMIYVEGLAHLETIPLRGAFFIFLPLKLAASSGGAGRAVGIIPMETE